MPRDTPPNILFLMSDEHRFDVAGFAGNGVVRTPTLDRLARGAAVFTNAYTPSPICVPGRQCMMAGQLPRTCRAEAFGDDLPPLSMTFARRLAEFGYHTVCAGKLHHAGPDQMQGWTQRLAPDAVLHERFIDRHADAPPPRPPEPGTGKRTNRQEVERAGIGRGPYQAFDQLAVHAACDFIQEHWADGVYDRPRDDRPTLLKVSLIQPHYPFLTDADKFTHYLNRVPVFNGPPRADHPVLGQTQMGPNFDPSPRDARRATAAYYGMVEQVDQHFARVIEQLEHVGQDLDDWWIVYTSDHGDMLGQHGIWEKTRFFEASVRVPLFVRPPARLREFWGFTAEGRSVDANVCLTDLFATLCEIADAPLPAADETPHGAGLDSRSLLPILKGQATPGHGWDNEAVSQIWGTDLMIKRDALKYSTYDRPDAGEVLFDLAADPEETRNVLDEPGYAAAVDAFRARRAELGFGPDAERDHYRNAGYRG
ncbi:MAG: sulfatase-like hydrolase/transferase [Planctomycetota bacterium]